MQAHLDLASMALFCCTMYVYTGVQKKLLTYSAAVLTLRVLSCLTANIQKVNDYIIDNCD